MNKLIDVHAHFLSKEYLNFLKKHNATLEDGFPLPTYNLDEHLKLNKDANIEKAYLSISSPHPYFEGYDQESISMCRLLNEQMFSLKKENNSLGYFACLPLPNVDASIQELNYSLDYLNADGIKLASNSRGLYLGDKSLDPLMEEMNKRNTICVIHPSRPEPIKEGLFSSGPVPLYEFIADTTRAVLNLIGNNVILRYPNIKWIIPHSGSFLPNIYNRFVGISKVLDLNIDIKESFNRLYYDVSGLSSNEALNLLLSITTPNHLLYGSDYPFTPINQIISNLDILPNIDFYNNAIMLFEYRGQKYINITTE